MNSDANGHEGIEAEPGVAPDQDRSFEIEVASDFTGKGRQEVHGDFEARINAVTYHEGDESQLPLPCQVLLATEDRSLTRLVELPLGSWTGRLPRARVFEIVAVKDPQAAYGFVASGTLDEQHPSATITVQQPSTWSLHVRDSVSHDELRNVSLAAFYGSAEVAMGLNGQSSPSRPTAGMIDLVSNTDSPITVVEASVSGFYWVSAPGYATRFFQHSGFQRDLEIELSAGGGLVLVPHPSLIRDGDLTLKVVSASGSTVFTRTITRTGEVRLPDLESGEYEVSARLRTESHGEIEVFRGTVQVPAGDWARLRITSDWTAGSSQLKLILVLPDHYKRASDWSVVLYHMQDQRPVYVTRETLAEWGAVEGAPVWEREFLSLARGDYRLFVQPVLRWVDLTLDGPEETVIVELSGTALVRVSCVLDHDDSKQYEVLWGYRDSGSMLNRRAVDPKTLEAAVYCEDRPIRLQVVAEGSESEIVDVSPEPGEVEYLSLTPARVGVGYLLLSLWQGGGHAFADSTTLSKYEVERIDGVGRLVRTTFGGEHGVTYGKLNVPDWSQALIVVSPPGRYRLSIPSIDQVFEVDIPSGETRHEVLLD